MSNQLGSISDLPADYYSGLVAGNTLPLWPSLRTVLPLDMPARKTLPALWRYADVRPNLLRAGELTPIEKAERRVLVLCNPGLGLENMQATPTIYIGMQLILPGETAPKHKHTPSAVRFVIEGNGGYTIVRGEKLPMEKGDLILTPSGLWHEHGHQGTGPVIWLDALDLPLVYDMEASYSIESPVDCSSDPGCTAAAGPRPCGVVPYTSLPYQRIDYPMLRYPWSMVRQTLVEMAGVTARDEAVHLAYVNPETGDTCLPTLGFSALMLRPGEELKPRRRSASAVLHVVEGAGAATIDGTSFSFVVSDTLAAPTHADICLSNASDDTPAFLFMVDDAPLHRKFGFYEVFA